MGKGYLQIKLFVGEQVLPVANMQVLVKDVHGSMIYELITDENGITDSVSLEAPDKKYSLEPSHTAPKYEVYDVEIPAAHGYKKTFIHNVEIFDTITSILPVQMHPIIPSEPPSRSIDEIFIPLEHNLEDTEEQTPLSEPDSVLSGNIHITERVLANEVRIPEYITVHLGSPNAAAQNVRVAFIDYIKNVASSEIFPTWEESALYANIFAQISFALNRVYTVWYRSRGFDYDITSSTAFDQSFVYGRNIFAPMSRIVDNIFNMFIRREGRREPFFASYCNGTTATCDGLSQWGSQELALRGYNYMQILKYYYPRDIQIAESNNFVAEVGTYPGTPLREGSTGAAVRTIQLYLNRISGNFYIPAAGYPDGNFGSSTKASVMAFQQINNLIPDGIVGKNTWYAISKIYVAVTELAELTSEGERIGVGQTPPTVTVQMGSRGEYVIELQFLLNYISEFYPAIPFVVLDGVFRDSTKRSVTEFQKNFGLTADGVVGPSTWQKLYEVFHSIQGAITPPVPSTPQFPGSALRIGSSGENVRLMQTYLNAIAKVYPSIPSLVADGNFGPATQASVIAFQNQFGLTPDGVIGKITWDKIVSVYHSLPSGTPPVYPGTPLRVGSRGSEVLLMQTYLNAISKIFPVIPALTADGVFGANTQSAVMAFQKLFGLTVDGVIGRNTWDKIVSVYNNLPSLSVPSYPGTALRVGSRGNDVIIMQKYLNAIAQRYPSIPSVNADGIFGANTEKAVIAFQRQFGLTADGVIGRITWNQIVSIFNLLNMTQVFSAYSASAPDYNFDKFALLMALSMFRR